MVVFTFGLLRQLPCCVDPKPPPRRPTWRGSSSQPRGEQPWSRSPSPRGVTLADITWSRRAVPAEPCPDCGFVREWNDYCSFKLLTFGVACCMWIIATRYFLGDGKEKCQFSYVIGLLFQVYIIYSIWLKSFLTVLELLTLFSEKCTYIN